MRKTIIALGIAALTGLAAAAPTASADERAAPEFSRAYPGESYSQYYYRRGYNPGAAAAAGIAGLAAPSSAAPSRTKERPGRCRRRRIRTSSPIARASTARSIP